MLQSTAHLGSSPIGRCSASFLLPITCLRALYCNRLIMLVVDTDATILPAVNVYLWANSEELLEALKL